MLFEEVGEGVYITTGEGRILEVNDAFVRMLGYDDRRQLLNIDLGQTVYQKPEDRERIRAEIQAKNFVRNVETTLRRRKDGSRSPCWKAASARDDRSGKIVRYQGFLVDISEQKRIENEIKRRNRELNALNAIAVIGAQSFDLDEILNVTLRQTVDLFQAESGLDLDDRRGKADLAAASDCRERTSLSAKSRSCTMSPELYRGTD